MNDTLKPITSQRLLIATRKLILPALVFPSDLQVRIAEDDKHFAITISVNPADMPRLIGQQGNNVRAIKGIFANIGQQHGIYLSFFAADPNKSTVFRYVVQPTSSYEAKPLLDAGNAVLDLAGYGEAIIGPVALEDKQFFTCTVPLSQSFFDSLARWMHVCGRANGINLVLQGGRIPV